MSGDQISIPPLAELVNVHIVDSTMPAPVNTQDPGITEAYREIRANAIEDSVIASRLTSCELFLKTDQSYDVFIQPRHDLVPDAIFRARLREIVWGIKTLGALKKKPSCVREWTIQHEWIYRFRMAGYDFDSLGINHDISSRR